MSKILFEHLHSVNILHVLLLLVFFGLLYKVYVSKVKYLILKLFYISTCLYMIVMPIVNHRRLSNNYEQALGIITDRPRNLGKNRTSWEYTFEHDSKLYKGNISDYGDKHLMDSVKIGDKFPVFFEKGNMENNALDFYSNLK